jgi:hypothetical protein
MYEEGRLLLVNYWSICMEGRRRRDSPAHLCERATNLKTYANQVGTRLPVIELTIIDAHCQRTAVTYLRLSVVGCAHFFPINPDGKQ